MQSLPKDVHPQVAAALIREKYDLGHVFYLDMWPVAAPMIVIQDPEIAAQLTQVRNHPKHPINKRFLRNMTGDKSIVTSEGPEWKSLRSMLAPAFTPAHLSTILPDITDRVMIFSKRLQSLAEHSNIFPMQDVAADLTIDVISQMAFGESLGAQTQFSSVAYNFRKTISWATSSLDIVSRIKKKIPMWWYCRMLDREIAHKIRQRYASRLPSPRVAKQQSMWPSEFTRTKNWALLSAKRLEAQSWTQISCS